MLVKTTVVPNPQKPIILGMKIHTQKTGFSLVELMVVIAIISILTTLSVLSYHSIMAKVHANEAKQSLYNAAKQYHLHQLVNPYLLNDLNANITFENNQNYRFQIEENKKKVVTFLAIKKHPNPQDNCAKLSLNTLDETLAYNSSGHEIDSCW